MTIDHLLNKKPRVVNDCTYTLGEVVQDKETGKMGVVCSILYFYMDSPKDFIIKTVGFDGKMYDFDHPLVLAKNLDEYLSIC